MKNKLFNAFRSWTTFVGVYLDCMKDVMFSRGLSYLQSLSATANLLIALLAVAIAAALWLLVGQISRARRR